VAQVEVSLDEFHVALLRLNRPEARNALSSELIANWASASRPPTTTPTCAAWC
jgi:enoyl-CoA hydratase/carnithine racemase